MSLLTALERWHALVGPEGIVSGPLVAARYGRCTTGTHRHIAAGLSPASREQIVPIVKIARDCGVSLYPISTGRNWGYGSALPVTDNCVILDLSRLRRIVEFDPDLGLLTIEPGVTQGMLAEFLERENHPYMVPVTGAGPTCSILGNALERGYGITPIADHFAAVQSLEAVLPDGRIYRPALAELGGTLADRAYKWGIGPYLDGLFTQSGLGIVTEMTIALARRPESVKAFVLGVRDEDDLEPLVAAIREILGCLPGTVAGINVMNAHRVLAMAGPYPAQRRGPDGLLTASAVRDLMRQYRVTPWTVFGTIYGPRRVVRSAQGVIARLLRPVRGRLTFVSLGTARTLRRATQLLPARWRYGLARRAAMLESALHLVAGYPSESALPLCYWLHGQLPDGSAPLDPARDGCGLIWYAPLVPMRPKMVRSYVDWATGVLRSHGCEPLITLSSLSERCFDSSVPLLFDLNDPDRARACYWALLRSGREQGFLPYRVGIDAMEWLTAGDVPAWNLVDVLKQHLDPSGIVSPGRYAPVGRAGTRGFQDSDGDEAR